MLKVIDEGPHHVAVVKPYNMVVVTGRGAPKPTLLDVAKKQFSADIRPVHRLDRATFGIVLLAKSQYGQQALSDAFRRRLVDKRYLAICEGAVPWKSLVIDARLSRIDEPNARKGPLAHQTIDTNGIRALTRVKVLAMSDKFLAIDARPETGRMHQIRVHLSHVGLPIVGDKLYGAQSDLAPNAIALCAFGISFPDPKGGRKYLSIEPPPEIKSFCQKQNLSLEAFESERSKFGK